MMLVIDGRGVVRCLYDEALDLACLGPAVIRRASHVEADANGHWWADLAPVGGPLLGAFARRSEALAAERTWLEEHWLTQSTAFAPADSPACMPLIAAKTPAPPLRLIKFY